MAAERNFMHELKLTRENENMTEATIGAWLVAEGEPVKADTPVVSVITDKAEFELEAGAEGFLRLQAVPVKSTVPVGTVLALVGAADEALPDIDATAESAPQNSAPQNIRATPAARRLAKEKNIDLAEVAKTSGGVVREEHIHAYRKDKVRVTAASADTQVVRPAGILGIGLDIVEVDRLEKMMTSHTERSRDRLFTEGEIAYCEERKTRYLHYAGRFAVKEAVFKALGTGWAEGVSWKQIDVWNRESGAPAVRLNGTALERFLEMGGKSIWVSISHTDNHAVAMVVLSG